MKIILKGCQKYKMNQNVYTRNRFNLFYHGGKENYISEQIQISEIILVFNYNEFKNQIGNA